MWAVEVAEVSATPYEPLPSGAGIALIVVVALLERRLAAHPLNRACGDNETSDRSRGLESRTATPAPLTVSANSDSLGVIIFAGHRAAFCSLAGGTRAEFARTPAPPPMSALVPPLRGTLTLRSFERLANWRTSRFAPYKLHRMTAQILPPGFDAPIGSSSWRGRGMFVGRRPLLFVVVIAAAVLAASATAVVVLSRTFGACYLALSPLPRVKECSSSHWSGAWFPGLLLALSLLVLVIGVGGGIMAASRQFRAARRIELHLRAHARVITPNCPMGPLALSAGVTAPVYACDTSSIAALTLGIHHPRIYVAESLLLEVTDAELVAVLAHEQSHAQRRDPLLLCAVRAAAFVAWPFPIVRVLARHVSLRAEVAADAQAVARAGKGPLLTVLHLVLTSSNGQPAGAASGLAGELEQRLRALCGEPIELAFDRGTLFLSAASLVITALAGAAFLRVMTGFG